MSDFGTAFVCKDHGTDATRLRVAFQFKTRRPRKMWCSICGKRTWWVPEDAMADELVVVVRQRTDAPSGIIFVHRRWVGRMVRIVPVQLIKNRTET